MAYDFNASQQQLSDLIRQYQQLQNTQPQIQPNTPQNFVIPQTVPIPIPSHQVQYVEGIEGARKYQLERLQPNSSEVIMDKDDNIFYMVSKDANGTPSKKIPTARFQLEEQKEEESPAFLTRKDLDEFKEEIRQLLKPDVSTPVGKSTKTIKEG